MADAQNLKVYTKEELFFQDLNDQNNHFVTRINERVEKTDCVPENIPDKVVKRDASGNFAAGTITANLVGNASTATAIANVSLVGMVVAFAVDAAPNGWLECDGAAVSRTTYAALFATIGTTFGSGDGSTTFNLPDLRGEFIRGWDHARGIDPSRVFGSAQGDEIRTHRHDMSRSSSGGIFDVSGTDTQLFIDQVPGNAGCTSSYGGNETRPRNIALMYCIKY